MDTLLNPSPPVSPSPLAGHGAPIDLDRSKRYRLHPSAAVRPEPFGALVYHYGNRKLVFLKSTRFVHLVEQLGNSSSIDEALDHAELAGPSRAKYLDALASLLRSDMIIEAPEVN